MLDVSIWKNLEAIFVELFLKFMTFFDGSQVHASAGPSWLSSTAQVFADVVTKTPLRNSQQVRHHPVAISCVRGPRESREPLARPSLADQKKIGQAKHYTTCSAVK